MRHKWCVVPLCKNTTARTPNKIFITVPREQDIRKKWLRAMKREDMSIKSTYYCCEDHFNLEEDVENFMKFSMVGGPIFLKKHVVPHKFDCQIKITTSKRKPKPKPRQAKKNSLTVIDGDEIVEKAVAGNSDYELSCSPETSFKSLKMVINRRQCKPKTTKKSKNAKTKRKNDKVIRTIVGGQILEERFRESGTDDSGSVFSSDSDNLVIDENYNFEKSKTGDEEYFNDKLDSQFSNSGKTLFNSVVEQSCRNSWNDNHDSFNSPKKKSCGVQASVKVADKGVQFPNYRNYKNTRDAACSPIVNMTDSDSSSASSDDSD